MAYNKSDLVSKIAQKSNLTKAQAEAAVNAFQDVFVEAMQSGEGLKLTGLFSAERVKRDGASTVFSAQDLAVDERTQRVGVRGLLTTFISDRRVSEVSKGYAIELQYAGGRIFLKAFRETSPNDPLEIQAQSQLRLAPAAGTGR